LFGDARHCGKIRFEYIRNKKFSNGKYRNDEKSLSCSMKYCCARVPAWKQNSATKALRRQENTKKEITEISYEFLRDFVVKIFYHQDTKGTKKRKQGPGSPL
jgi:hypothetical protein